MELRGSASLSMGLRVWPLVAMVTIPICLWNNETFEKIFSFGSEYPKDIHDQKSSKNNILDVSFR